MCSTLIESFGATWNTVYESLLNLELGPAVVPCPEAEKVRYHKAKLCIMNCCSKLRVSSRTFAKQGRGIIEKQGAEGYVTAGKKVY